MAATTDNKSRPQIAVARSESEKQEIFRFRYRIYVEEMHQDRPDADEKNKMLRDSLDDTGIHLMMSVGGKVAATIRLNLGKLTPIPGPLREAYALDRFVNFPAEQISITSQIIVSEKWRSSNVPAVLLGATYKLARQQGIRFDFCHCQPFLVSLYEQLGYRRYTDNFVDPNSGYNLPLILVTEDIEYLRACGSPFFKLATQHPSSAKTALWFQHEFPDYAAGSPRAGMTEDDFWKQLTQKLHQIPLVSIPLLKDLTYDEAKKFLNVGTVLQSKRGDKIVRAGDVGNEMFVLLTGAVEVRTTDSQDSEHVLTTMGQGDVFGELAFLSAIPRTADVVAVADSEVLVLTQQFFERATKAMPAVTAKVLFNMSLILCERLKNSTDNWMAAVADAQVPTTLEQSAE
ncbi:MAG: cyclic nucleotide-binding domain-containing protein [Alphaproteobacteria bacterium]|nr:cyclic nucleotide-binding domain-containing protein [Alphaproteobacteria bacterium]MDP6518232.1 cyclic nucleotide-binding domain-containing protein [Alphaproteobacteria bacterium]